MNTLANALIVKAVETQLNCILEGDQSYILELVGNGCVLLSCRSGYGTSAEIIKWLREVECDIVVLGHHLGPSQLVYHLYF